MPYENTEDTATPPNKELSRKDFLSLTGKSLLVSSALSAGIPQKGVIAQTKKGAKLPPARVPAAPQQPIVLEAWKSDANLKGAPTPTPLPADQRIGYAVVGLGHLALEGLLPALRQCGKSKMVALVSGNPKIAQLPK